VLWQDTDVSEVHSTLKMEAAWTSETSVSYRNIKRLLNPEELELKLYHRENLKSLVIYL
jgi:hypothetical protein